MSIHAHSWHDIPDRLKAFAKTCNTASRCDPRRCCKLTKFISNTVTNAARQQITVSTAIHYSSKSLTAPFDSSKTSTGSWLSFKMRRVRLSVATTSSTQTCATAAKSAKHHVFDLLHPLAGFDVPTKSDNCTQPGAAG